MTWDGMELKSHIIITTKGDGIVRILSYLQVHPIPSNMEGQQNKDIQWNVIKPTESHSVS